MSDRVFTLGSLYAGVGGICLGFQNAGFQLSWANELDHRACTTYRANFKHRLYEEDVWLLDPKHLQPVDVLAAGFPCQPFSVAGYREGFRDRRGNHFFRIIDFIQALRPAAVLLENVKNLETHDDGRTFRVITDTLQQQGYTVFHKVLNTKEYGNVPHNRERIFIVAFNSLDFPEIDFCFPEAQPLTVSVQDLILKRRVEQRYYYGEERYMYKDLVAHVTRPDRLYQWRRWYVRENKSGVCPTLTASMGTGGHNVPLVKTRYGIRKLTPAECFEFQGFPVASGSYRLPDLAPSHLYKQAGNAVSVTVIKRLASAIKLSLSKGR
jgi:DNA (cytosine-5)-methyltransferase 1